MKKGMKILWPILAEKNIEGVGTVVLGTVNDPTAELWGIFNCKDKGTLSPYNPWPFIPLVELAGILA